jgi:glutathione synthase/RimK-type ligase-like ATP-grasp enzyme
MIAVSNYLSNPKNAEGYKSLRHLARRIEQSINPSKAMQRLLGKMQALKFLAINRDDMIVFDADVFDAFVEEHVVGREWWSYFDDHTVFPRLK